MTSNSDKHGEFRVSFAEILVGFSSDGLVLLPPSDLRSRKQINIGAKQLADYCHIYMVLQRPGLSFVPDQVYDSGDSVYGKLKLTAGRRINLTDFEIPHGGDSLKWTVSEFPHRTIVGESAFFSHNEILPAYAVPSLGRVIHKSAHEAEVLYVGQAFGDGSRKALDRLADHSTLQSVLADAIHEAPDQEILLLLLEYAPPKKHMLIPPESTYPSWYEVRDEEVQTEIDRRMEQLKHSRIPAKNCTSIVEAALINYFKPRYNEKFIHQPPQASHQHMVECYNEDFSALMVELNTEDAQISLYSQRIIAGFHHLAKFDLHNTETRKAFFQLAFFWDEVGLTIESGPIVPPVSLKNGRFRILGL